MAKIQCVFCGKGPEHGVNLYRLNEKGVEGRWACDKHINQTDADVPEEVQNVVDAINPKGNPHDR